MAHHHISLPKALASGDVNEWFKHCDICCKANGWNETTSALKLPTLLEGEALAIWLELSEEQQGDYAAAKKEICTAMMPMDLLLGSILILLTTHTLLLCSWTSLEAPVVVWDAPILLDGHICSSDRLKLCDP